jgi:hexosaminidase
MRRILTLIFSMVIGINAMAQTNTAIVDAHQLSISWEALQNTYQNKQQSLNALVITNNGHITLPASGWNVYCCSGGKRQRHHRPS